ncbi:hypothetical protein PENPOL_c025G09208 [Penicillium polonicum]|uniref:Yeast cell wall synthesis Kre9/Knh1-like N-terminal domain-containing protein n=1 Tax=Penicillium polonicum TaxID=60169 RepID=A0A1V6N6Q5_PENPO|nr:hypothetical protein PENPOL_c025G09208 [Penicillium polonicum]
MRVNIISLVALATTVAGLTVTSPRIGEKIDPDLPLTIKWQAVTTDPETFSIELVNQNVYPPTTTIVADDIDSSKGSYTVKAKTFTDVDNGDIRSTSSLRTVAFWPSLSNSESLSPVKSLVVLVLVALRVYPYLVLFYCFTFHFYPYNVFFYKLFCKCVYLFHFIFYFHSFNILIFDIHNFLHFNLNGYHSLFFLGLFYIYTCNFFLNLFYFYLYTFNFFFHHNLILDYIYILLCYPDYFYFHYQVFHTSPYLDFPHIKHCFFYHIPFYPHLHYYPWLVKDGKHGFRDSILLLTHDIKEKQSLTLSIVSTPVSTVSSSSLSTASHSSTTSTTTRKATSTATSTATESASTTSNAAVVLMPPAGSLLLGLLALVL